MLFYKNYLCYSIKKLFTFFIFIIFFFAAYYKMEDLKLKDLNLSLEESRDIIEFLARKRNVSNYKRKSDDELWHALKEYRPTNNQQQQIKSKNKETIHVIREELKELSYKLSKSELKEIKKNLYQIENKKGSLE